MEIIQCPNCSANNIEVLSKGVYKCNDCGSVFTTNDASPKHNVPEKYVSGKSKIAAALFGIFLGSLGIHKFYLGNIGTGILYLLFCWTAIPGIVGFIEGLVYLCQSDADFAKKHPAK